MSDTESLSTPSAPTEAPKLTTPDDLLKMYEDEVIAKKDEITKEAEKAVQVKEEIPKIEAAKKLEEAAKTLPKPEEQRAEQDEEEASEKEATPARKTIQAKLGDEAFDVPEDAEFSTQINGKQVNFKAKDAVQAFTKQEEFNRNMDRRITHISQREKRWESDQQNLKSKIDKVIEVTRTGDFVSGIRALAKLAAGDSGVDVVEFERKYFEQLDKINELWTKLTPVERDKFFAERKASVLEEELKSKSQQEKLSQERSSLDAQIKSLQKEHGFSEDEFWGHYKYLAENAVGEGKHYKNPDAISPQDVVKFGLQVRLETKVAEAAEKVGLEDEEVLDEVSKLVAGSPQFTVDDIVSIIEKSGVAKKAPPSVVENLNRKAEKSNSKSQFSKASSTKKNENGMDEEDVNFLYRRQPRNYRSLYR